MSSVRSIYIAGLLLLSLCSTVTASEQAATRTTLMISDTHMGLGKVGQQWEATEDFRWPEALENFLQHASLAYGDRIDLVILGDFLELWQVPVDMRCAAPTGDLGCTPAEMVKIATRVVNAHARELQSLRDFSQRGDNHMVVLPGNHDAALLLPEVWKLLEKPLDLTRGRVTLEKTGTWQSADKFVYAEHGHQIGSDANKYAKWPQITAMHASGTFVVRPWGEQFVQGIFNDVERDYPIIDNLSPESAGVRYRIADKGYPAAAKDVARFFMFNLFETSLKQKAQVLGDECEGSDEPCEPGANAERWDLEYARKLGAALPIAGLDKDDPFRQLLEEQTEYGKQVRTELQRRVETSGTDSLSREEILQLCDQAAIRGELSCQPKHLGATVASLLYSKESVLRRHLIDRQLLDKGVAFYIYGHTHQLETPWTVKLDGSSSIKVANTGAFQRLVDEVGFKRLLADRHISPERALRTLEHKDLPACYSFVVVTRKLTVDMETYRWYQPDTGQGLRVEVGDSRCEATSPPPQS